MNTYGEYIDEDFNHLSYNIRELNFNESIVSKWNAFKLYSEFKMPTVLPLEKVLRYVIYGWDSMSPVHKLTSIMHKRTDAALLAGFVPNEDGKFTDDIDKMLKGMDRPVNYMIIRYCMMTGANDYAILNTYENSLLAELKNLMDASTDDTISKKETLANISTLRKEINTLKGAFFKDNLDVLLNMSFEEYKDSVDLNLGPEAIAKKIKGWNHISRYYVESNWEEIIGAERPTKK